MRLTDLVTAAGLTYKVDVVRPYGTGGESMNPELKFFCIATVLAILLFIGCFAVVLGPTLAAIFWAPDDELLECELWGTE